MKCITPEMPYCPLCEFGHIVMKENSDTECEWVCLCEEEEYIPEIDWIQRRESDGRKACR